MNIQFAIKKDDGLLYVLEVNPRASRTVPFVAKATGLPVAKIAAKVMTGMSLAELGHRLRSDSEPRFGQRERLSVPQVPGRRHRAGARDAVDRRSDGSQRPLFDRLCQKPIGRRHGVAAVGHDFHQRRSARQGTHGRPGPAIDRNGLQPDGHRGNRPAVGRGRRAGRVCFQAAGRASEPDRLSGRRGESS